MMARIGAPLVKICGLSRAQDIAAANEASPDFIGFVFVPQSRRCVSIERALRLRAALSPSIRVVGVFQDSPIDEAVSAILSRAVDIAQLHGDEDDSYIAELRERTGAKIIRAFRPKDAQDALLAAASNADDIMLDAGAGDGILLDPSIAAAVTTRRYFLAGGLTPLNVRSAIDLLHPYAVDVSSGVETDGAKDAEKIRAFVDAVRSAV